jgi:F0F1-type ATP synthase membrane subunit b/b'
MSHTPVLIPDWTVFVQLGIFFATWFVLRTFVFVPYLKLLKVRREKTVGLKEKAHHTKDLAAKLQAEYEAFMTTERKKINSWMDQERSKISDEERNIVNAARDTVAEEMQAVREKIQADTDQVRRDLLPLAADFSSQIASKLVGHKVNITAFFATGKGAAFSSEQVVPR